MSETVRDVVAAYKQGELTLDQLANNLAGRRWPPPPAKPTDTIDRMDWADDVDYFAPGTWNGEVRRLMLTGDLTSEEYQAISERVDEVADQGEEDGG